MSVGQHLKIFVYGLYMNPKYLDQKGITYFSEWRSFIVGYDICFSTRTDDWKKSDGRLEGERRKRIRRCRV